MSSTETLDIMNIITSTSFNSIKKVQSYKLHNNKYIIASTRITNTEILAFIAILVFKLLRRKVLLKTEQTIKTVKK